MQQSDLRKRSIHGDGAHDSIPKHNETHHIPSSLSTSPSRWHLPSSSLESARQKSVKFGYHNIPDNSSSSSTVNTSLSFKDSTLYRSEMRTPDSHEIPYNTLKWNIKQPMLSLVSQKRVTSGQAVTRHDMISEQRRHEQLEVERHQIEEKKNRRMRLVQERLIQQRLNEESRHRLPIEDNRQRKYEKQRRKIVYEEKQRILRTEAESQRGLIINNSRSGNDQNLPKNILQYQETQLQPVTHTLVPEQYSQYQDFRPRQDPAQLNWRSTTSVSPLQQQYHASYSQTNQIPITQFHSMQNQLLLPSPPYCAPSFNTQNLSHPTVPVSKCSCFMFLPASPCYTVNVSPHNSKLCKNEGEDLQPAQQQLFPITPPEPERLLTTPTLTHSIYKNTQSCRMTPSVFSTSQAEFTFGANETDKKSALSRSKSSPMEITKTKTNNEKHTLVSENNPTNTDSNITTHDFHTKLIKKSSTSSLGQVNVKMSERLKAYYQAEVMERECQNAWNDWKKRRTEQFKRIGRPRKLGRPRKIAPDQKFEIEKKEREAQRLRELQKIDAFEGADLAKQLRMARERRERLEREIVSQPNLLSGEGYERPDTTVQSSLEYFQNRSGSSHSFPTINHVARVKEESNCSLKGICFEEQDNFSQNSRPLLQLGQPMEPSFHYSELAPVHFASKDMHLPHLAHTFCNVRTQLPRISTELPQSQERDFNHK